MIIFPRLLDFFVKLNGKVLFSLNCCHPLPTWAGASNSGIILTPLILAYWIRSWISFLQKYLFYHSPALSHFPLYSVVLKIKTIFFFLFVFQFFLKSGVRTWIQASAQPNSCNIGMFWVPPVPYKLYRKVCKQFVN